MVNNSPANAGDAREVGSIPGSGRSPGEGNGNSLQYSCLENSMDRGTWWATVHGVARSMHAGTLELVGHLMSWRQDIAKGQGMTDQRMERTEILGSCSESQNQPHGCQPLNFLLNNSQISCSLCHCHLVTHLFTNEGKLMTIAT